MKITEIKHNLQDKDKKELTQIIISLYKLDKKNCDFLDSYLNPESEDIIFEKYKKIIQNEFFPNKGMPKLRYSVLRTAINDFKKIVKSPKLIADLMLFYVSTGVEFTDVYGDIDETFYIKIENMYNDALKHIFKNNLDREYIEKCIEAKSGTDCVGWGFEENMDDIFYANYDMDEYED